MFFDLGTTVMLMAKLIADDYPITAFTNALRTAQVLSDKSGCDVIIPGGKLRGKELAVSGSLAEETMRQFNLDKVFIGVAGITEDGITDFNIEEAGLRRQVIRNARQVIVLADSSKFGIRAVSNICPVSDIDILITDSGAPTNLLSRLEKSGVRIVIAE